MTLRLDELLSQKRGEVANCSSDANSSQPVIHSRSWLDYKRYPEAAQREGASEKRDRRRLALVTATLVKQSIDNFHQLIELERLEEYYGVRRKFCCGG